MSGAVQARILRVYVECDPVAVAAFIANPLNLPKWAHAFCKSVRRRNEEWIAETSQGAVAIRFVAPNPYGVVDHYVVLPSGQEIYVPMRVVANGPASDVHFTLFRSPHMSDAQFDDDAAMVEGDLLALKQAIEARAE